MNNKERDLQVWREHIKNFLQVKAPSFIASSSKALEIGKGDSTPILSQIYKDIKVLDKRTDVGADYELTLFDKNIHAKIPKFESIFMIEVLEHTEKPWEVESIVKSILEPDGLLCVTVPSFLWWHPLANVYGDYWRFLPGHIENLFPNMESLYAECESSDYGRPLGMCYILKNK